MRDRASYEQEARECMFPGDVVLRDQIAKLEGERAALIERVEELEAALKVDDKLIVALSDLAQANAYNQASLWAEDAKKAVVEAQYEFQRARAALSENNQEAEQHGE